jgi:hypothetical protein
MLNSTEIMHKTRTQIKQQSDVELIKKQTMLLLLCQLHITDMYIVLTKTCKINHC